MPGRWHSCLRWCDRRFPVDRSRLPHAVYLAYPESYLLLYVDFGGNHLTCFDFESKQGGSLR